MGLYPKQELIKKNNFSFINVDPKYLFGTNSENICRFSGLDDRVGFGRTDISTFWVAPKLVHIQRIYSVESQPSTPEPACYWTV